MPDTLRYATVFSIYYKFYAATSITLQLILLFLIRFKSPSSLDHLKYFMYNTNIVQIALVLTAFSTQHRVVPNIGSTAILATGPCTWFGPNICFISYIIYTALSVDTAMSISTTVFFRYFVLIANYISGRKVILIVFSSHLLAIILLIAPFCDTWNFAKLRQSTYAEHASYNFSIYEPFFGFADTSTFPFLVGSTVLALGTYGIPLCSGILTRKVLMLIRFNQNMSSRTKKQAMTLIYGLLCQTIFPFVIYTPIFSCYVYTQFTGTEILLSEHLFLALPSLPGLIDPLISFYFVVPYRRALLQFCLRKKEPIVNIYYHVYFVCGLSFQFLLVFLITKKSPSSLANLKYFLRNTALVQIIGIITGYFTQHRSLPNSTTFAVLSVGFCRKISPYVCFSTYHIYYGVVFAIALSISNTVLFRYMVLKIANTGRKHVIWMLVLSYIPPLATAVIPFTDTWDFESVRLQSKLEHPHYNLSIYEPFSGFGNIESFQFVLVTSMIGVGAYGIPLMSALLTRSILRMINRHSAMSTRTKTQARTLIYGLICQTLLPLICYIPIFSLYRYSQTNGVESLISEHGLLICSSFPCLIDPFISFYFVVPYRNALMRMLTGRPEEKSVTIAAPSSISVRSVSIRIR
ncbi:unnamed protein product [Caenorhabditis bovis]|uniref:Uncharacterized protein n=1 Tax=Caenorhabditis bovis TaxID=2654633 RepID=A0A8S1EWC4_9PELO|nr:unnamed protein product [Caenorhabditis bovis]